jgi:hypothetical protein
MPFSKFNAVFSRVIVHLFGPLSAGFADALRVGADTFPKPARLGMAYLSTLLQGHRRGKKLWRLCNDYRAFMPDFTAILHDFSA